MRAVVTIITTSKWFSEMLFELFAGNYFYFENSLSECDDIGRQQQEER